MESITQDFTLGRPQVVGPLAVFPVFGPEPRLEYRAFADAAALGAFVREREQVSINDLVIENPTDLPLLVFEGEEVLGAKQNRTFDVSVLVAAGKRAQVPVSCVEEGRWTAGGEAHRFAPSQQAADPRLRRVKRVRANAHAAAGAEARPDQGEVWNEVRGRLAEHDVASPSGALSDVYDHNRGALLTLAGGIHHEPGQIGALVEVEGRPLVLDLVSRRRRVRLAAAAARAGLRARGAQPARAARGRRGPRGRLPAYVRSSPRGWTCPRRDSAAASGSPPPG